MQCWVGRSFSSSETRMSWQQLLARRRVQAHTTHAQELEGLRTVVARDLKDADLPELSTDRRFAIAYNAVLQLATMVIACTGYRVRGVGYHQSYLRLDTPARTVRRPRSALHP